MTENLFKLSPNRNVSLQGVSRSGAMGAMHNASPSGFTVSGMFSGQADFCNLLLWDADDYFGHWQTTKYEPDFDFTEVTLDCDLSYFGLFGLLSQKFQSVNQGLLTVQSPTSVNTTVALINQIATVAGGVAASITFTVNSSSTPQAFDRIQIWYLNNLFDYLVPASNAQQSFPFFSGSPVSGGWSIAIGSNTYAVTTGQMTARYGTYTSADVAFELAKAASDDPNCTVEQDPLNPFELDVNPRINTGASVTITATGSAAGTMWLTTTPLATIAAALASEINSYNWVSAAPSYSLFAVAVNGNVKVYCGRYGTCNTSGTAVTWASGGMKFLGCKPGDSFQIAGVPYSIAAVNSPTSLTLSASAGTQTGAAYLATAIGQDGNTIALYELHKTTTAYLTPAGSSQMTGGAEPQSVHVHLDFSALGITSVRQILMTLAPALTVGSGSQSLAAYAANTQWSATFANWTVGDPSNRTPLYIAGPGSVRVGSQDLSAVHAGSGWALEAGFFYHGFAEHTAHTGDTVTVTYSCSQVHDLYLGTSLYTDRGIVGVTLDSVSLANVDCYLSAIAPVQTRRVLQRRVAAGTHTVVITQSGTKNSSSTGFNFYFDFLEASVLAPATALPAQYNRFAATDWDTQHGYQIPPQRLAWMAEYAGLKGDWDHYIGAFQWNWRALTGGVFSAATVTFTGTFTAGNGFGGSADQISVIVGGTTCNKTVYPQDTNSTIAQHFADFINSVFVGVRASAAANVLTVTVLSPLNGFTFTTSFTPASGSTGVVTKAGTLVAAAEGIWQVNPAVLPVLNRAAFDWHLDFFRELYKRGFTCTCSVSQELLNPPDNPGSSQVWIQRFNAKATNLPSTAVYTGTASGTGGAGFVLAVTTGPPISIQMTGHGYSSGMSVNISGGGGSGTWLVTVTDANNFQLSVLLSGGYTPSNGDNVSVNLVTSQCAFSAVVSAYLASARALLAQMMISAGLEPKLQLGEVGHWFFSSAQIPIASASSGSGGVIEIATTIAHGFATGNTVIVPVFNGLAVVGTTWGITVIDSTHFTLFGSIYNAGYTYGQNASGGSMAYYDADQTAAASAALGRSLAVFTCQDSSPLVNGGQDAAFLQNRVNAFILQQVETVEQAAPGTQWEALFPFDVNFTSVQLYEAFPFPQGGRMNALVNFPQQYLPSGALAFFKTEGLSWGSAYRSVGLIALTAAFAASKGWPLAQQRYLFAWFNGGCPWPAELTAAKRNQVPLIGGWAFDQLCLLSWPLPLA